MNKINNELEIHTDTPQNATSATITLDKDASNRDGAYTGQVLRIIEGAGRGEQQTIKSYDGRTKIAALHGTWITTPDTTSVYVIMGPEPMGFGVLTKTNNKPKRHIGILQDVIPTTLTLDKMLINLNINPDIKAQFEQLKGIHEMTFSDALEIGMKIAIKSTQSTDEVRRKINEKKIELQDLYTELYFIKETQRHPQEDTDFRWDKDGGI